MREFKIKRLEEVTSFKDLHYGELTPEEEKEVLRLAREAFTADDLQKYTELGPWVSADELLAEMEEYQLLSDIFDESVYPPE